MTGRRLIAMAALQAVLVALAVSLTPLWAGAIVGVLAGLTLWLARYRTSGDDDARSALSIQLAQSQEREARYREYAEAAADWYWESDADHRFSWFSPEFEAVLGVKPERMLGERMEIDSQQWQAHIADLTAQRPFRDFKYWLEDGRGRSRWIKINGLPRFDESGAFIGYRGIGIDISAAVESAHRMHMLNRAVEQSPVSIVITDLDARIQYVNGEFLRVTGYGMDEVIGCNPRILRSEHTPDETFRSMWQALAAGSKWEGELVNRRKSGELYWEWASIQPIQNIEGEFTNYLAIKTDITEQKANEARLAQLVEELGRSNEELEQFAYVASHDLRQPLRMISAYIALLQKNLGPTLDEDNKTFLGFAIEGARRLDRMIIDLLEYSRIGRLAAALPVDLNQAIADSLRHLEIAITEAGAEVRVAPGLPTVAGDESELVRLFQNLIGNAIKYTAPRRPARVEIDWRDSGAEWVVAVRDNGIGIASEDRDRVFGIFQRLVSREQYEGTGIGLAVCRKIAEHHGGRIWVESEPDVGSTFSVAFAKAPVASPY